MRPNQYDIYDVREQKMIASDLDAEYVVNFFASKGYEIKRCLINQYANTVTFFKEKFVITHHGESMEDTMERRRAYLEKRKNLRDGKGEFDEIEFEEAVALFKNVQWVKCGGKKLVAK